MKLASRIVAAVLSVVCLASLNQAHARKHPPRVRLTPYADVGYWEIYAKHRRGDFLSCEMSHDLGFVKTDAMDEGIKAHTFSLTDKNLVLEIDVAWQLSNGHHPYQMKLGDVQRSGKLEYYEGQIYNYGKARIELPRNAALIRSLSKADHLALTVRPNLPTVRVGVEKFAEAFAKLQECSKEKGVQPIAAWTECVSEGDTESRITNCTTVFTRNRKAPGIQAQALYNRGKAYSISDDDDHALTDFSEAIRLSPNYAAAFVARADVYVRKGDYDHAVTDASEAIRLKSDYAEAFYSRGNALNGKGERDRAVTDYSEAIRLNPRYADAFSRRGDIYFAVADLDRAIADYSEALNVGFSSEHLLYGRGKAYELKGDYERAIADYTQALRFKPDDPGILSSRGDAYEKKGELEQAKADHAAADRLRGRDGSTEAGAK